MGQLTTFLAVPVRRVLRGGARAAPPGRGRGTPHPPPSLHKRCKLDHALLWEHSYKTLELAQLLGQLSHFRARNAAQVLDNVLWKGRVADPSATDKPTAVIRALNAKVARRGWRRHFRAPMIVRAVWDRQWDTTGEARY